VRAAGRSAGASCFVGGGVNGTIETRSDPRSFGCILAGVPTVLMDALPAVFGSIVHGDPCAASEERLPTDWTDGIDLHGRQRTLRDGPTLRRCEGKAGVDAPAVESLARGDGVGLFLAILDFASRGLRKRR
jgi:hypothetical protein